MKALRGSASRGSRYHDNCRCIAVPVRPGQSYEPPDYVARWDDDYQAARAAGARTPGQIAAAMDKAEGARRAPKGQGGVQRYETPPPATAGGSDGPKGPTKPPGRVRGMLGPETPDEFGKFGDYEPPARRSQIDEFTFADAEILMDDSMDPTQRQILADLVRRALDKGTKLPARPHGGHRWGTGWAKSEFPSGWTEEDVLDWIRAVIDRPLRLAPNRGHRQSFQIFGQHNGVFGVVRVRPILGSSKSWYISTAHPVDPAVLLGS